MNIETAKKIYEAAREYHLSEDYILECEGYDKKEYEEALSLYLNTLPKKEITMGWEEEMPKYECWRGTRFPQWM